MMEMYQQLNQLNLTNNTTQILTTHFLPTIIYHFFQSLHLDSKKQQIHVEFNNIMKNIIMNLQNNPTFFSTFLIYLSIFYKMTAFVRDIEYGYGQRDNFYYLVIKWYEYFPELALYLLDNNFKSVHLHEQPYGSWKDVKYFCQFVKEETKQDEHPLIIYSLKLMVNQLKQDYQEVQNNEHESQNGHQDINNNNNNNKHIQISLAAKWAPREKSQHQWIFNKLSQLYYPYFFSNNQTEYQRKTALLKCKTQFRKVCSTLNNQLHTFERLQSEQRYQEIHIDHLTSHNILSKNRWILNMDEEGKQQSFNNGRIELSNEMKQKIENNDDLLFHKQFCWIQLIKMAWDNVESKNKNVHQEKFINTLWKQISNQIEPLINILPVIDSSFSMDEYSLYKALGIGLLICEKSNLGKRVLVSNVKGFWINLEPYDNLIDMVKIIKQKMIRVNCNLVQSYKSICSMIFNQPHSKEVLKDINIVILSNLHFDNPQNIPFIKHIYNYFDTNKRPHLIPKTIFWKFNGNENYHVIFGNYNSSVITGTNLEMINMFWSKKYSSRGITLTTNFLFTKMIDKCFQKLKFQVLEDKIWNSFMSVR